MMPNKVARDENLISIIQLFVPEVEVLEITPIVTGHINQTYKIDYLRGRDVDSLLLQNLNTHVFGSPEAVLHNNVRSADFLEDMSEDDQIGVRTPVVLADVYTHLKS